MNKTSKTASNSGAKILSEPIIFFGSGPVAAASLELLETSLDIELVITKPRLAHHHGSVPVIELAEKLSLPVLTVTDKADLSVKLSGANLKSRLAVLIDFGIIVSREVIDTFELGIVNSHFSLLPEWRGADPITFAILSGQRQTGVSLMLLVEGMDKGPLLGQMPYDIEPAETTQSLTNVLIEESYILLREILPMYIAGTALPAPQEAVTMAQNSEPSYSRKLTKADGVLDLTKPAVVLEREIRAYSEWPKSRTTIAGKDVVITSAHDESIPVENVDNKTIFVANKQLCLRTSDGILVIDSLKPAGKSNMLATAFLAGYGKNL